jgi:predicted dehydrogenase
MIKAGVLGLGKMGLRHLAAYRVLHMDVVAFDSDPKVQCAESSQKVARARSVEELLEAVDVVSVCTPVSEHANLIRAAIEARVHVLCEKPVVLDLTVCDQLIRAEASSSLVIVGGYLMRFASEVSFFKETIGNSDHYGRPLFACITKTARGDHAVWKHIVRHGGGAEGEVMVHGLDLARYLFGEISSGLEASELLLPVRQIDSMSVEVDAADTVTELLTAGRVPTVVQANMLGKVPYTSLSVIFERGKMHARLGSAIVSTQCDGVSRAVRVQSQPWLLAQVKEFVDSVEYGRKSLRMHGLSDTRALLARYRERI